MGLFDRFTNVTNKNVTLKNIDKVTDDNVLADIALNNSDFYISNEAVSRIKDDSILALLVHSGGSNSLSCVGMHALECISDENVIADLWCNSGVEFSSVSLNKISDSDLLVRIAKEAPNSQNRDKVLKLIPDSDEILYDIYKNSRGSSASDMSIRNDVTYKIRDQDILKSIASSDSVYDIRATAVKHITDESFLIDVVKTYDSKGYKRYYLNRKDDYVRENAIGNISDKSFLEDVADNDRDKYIRDVATRRLKQLD